MLTFRCSPTMHNNIAIIKVHTRMDDINSGRNDPVKGVIIIILRTLVRLTGTIFGDYSCSDGVTLLLSYSNVFSHCDDRNLSTYTGRTADGK